jgi:carbohydrate-selective porin OprB
VNRDGTAVRAGIAFRMRQMCRNHPEPQGPEKMRMMNCFIPASIAVLLIACLCAPARGDWKDLMQGRLLPPPPAHKTPAGTSAGPFPAPPDYRGNLLQRGAMTGDWEGWRSYFADKGFTLDVDLTQIFQGNLSRGADNNDAFPYGGSYNIQGYFDTGKMGLWPGGFVTVKAEGLYGKNNNSRAGALMPVNADALFPVPDTREFTLTEYKLIQFLTKRFGIILGKIDTLEGGDSNVFANDYKNQFMNVAFLVNPVTFRTTPYSALGAGAMYIFSEHLATSVIVLDANGSANHGGYDTAFSDPRGLTIANEWDLTMKPLGRTGHFRAGWIYGTKRYFLLEQDRRLNLPLFQELSDSELTRRVQEILSRDRSALAHDDSVLRRARGIIDHDRRINDRDRRVLDRAASIAEDNIIARGDESRDADILRRARDILAHERRINSRDRRVLDRAGEIIKREIAARAKDALAREKAALSDRSLFLLERAGDIVLSDQDRGFKQGNGDYCFYFNFDQYLYNDKEDPSQGFGLFGRFGFSDGRFNPIARFYSIGLGGKGLIPTRDGDSYGVGYYYTLTSDDLNPVLGVGDEQGIELYYNFHLTPWCRITPDFQVVHTGLKSVPTVSVLGFRTQMYY